MSDERDPLDEHDPVKPRDDVDGSFTSSDFHTVTQKLILNAANDMLTEAKLSWPAVLPFLETARDMARGDFEQAKVRLHTLQAQGEQWVDAREAFLGISVADRDDGEEWLAETWWISEIATADGDPDQVRAIIRALEKSLVLLHVWLAEREGGAEAPPSET